MIMAKIWILDSDVLKSSFLTVNALLIKSSAALLAALLRFRFYSGKYDIRYVL